MNATPFSVVPLGSQDRKGFSCGVEALDRYFHTQVTQDIKRRVSACFIAVDQATGLIAGYYTLSAAEVPLATLSPEIIARLPRYPTVPVARIGRLAIDQHYQGRKLGAAMLVNAALRAARSDIAVHALVVDAKDEKSEAFYRHFGFTLIDRDTRKLVIPIATIQKLPEGG